MTPRLSTVAALVLFIAIGAGCHSSAPRVAPPPPTAHWTGDLAPAPAPPGDSDVVAVVNGDRIFAADVASQMSATGQTAERALAELVDAQLLAQEAMRRGLADDPEVVEARQRESVRLLLRRVFEPSFDGPEDIPEDEVESVANLPEIKPHYEHPEYHTVVFARAKLPPKAPADAEAAAKVKAEQMAAILVAARPASKEAFLKVVADHPELGVSGEPRPFSTSSTGPAHPTFAKAAMALAKIGDLSPPVRTPWGWDILFLDSVIAAKHTPKDVMEADIRKNWFEPARKRAFDRFTDGLLAQHKIVKNEAALDAVQVDALVGLP